MCPKYRHHSRLNSSTQSGRCTWSFWENENFQQLQQVLVWEICTLSNWYIQYNNTFESIISLYSSVSYQLLVLSHCFKPLHTCYLLYHNSPTYISAGWWQSGRFGYSRHPGTYSSIRFAVLRSPHNYTPHRGEVLCPQSRGSVPRLCRMMDWRREETTCVACFRSPPPDAPHFGTCHCSTPVKYEVMNFIHRWVTAN